MMFDTSSPKARAKLRMGQALFSPAIKSTFENDTRKLKAAINDHGNESCAEKTRFTLNIFHNMKNERMMFDPQYQKTLASLRRTRKASVNVGKKVAGCNEQATDGPISIMIDIDSAVEKDKPIKL